MLATGAAAACANFLILYSGYLPGEKTIELTGNACIGLLVVGLALALPLDRLIRYSIDRSLVEDNVVTSTQDFANSMCQTSTFLPEVTEMRRIHFGPLLGSK